jgi:hypothetical protein
MISSRLLGVCLRLAGEIEIEIEKGLGLGLGLVFRP